MPAKVRAAAARRYRCLMRKSFAEITTMRVGGDASDYVAAEHSQDVVSAVREADDVGMPVLVVGDGSNLVVGDCGFDGRVVAVKTSGLEFDSDGAVHVDAGVTWDSLVEMTLAEGLGGLEALSGVPGSTGGTPVQNVGAYGALVSTFLSGVTVWDRESARTREIAVADCGFGSHRTSIFKGSDRFVILRVHFRLPRTRQSQPVGYSGLATRLGVQVGDQVSTEDVRKAVLELRRERGMVLDADDPDTWSVGSFFVNPVVETVPEQAAGCPTYDDVAGTKLPAAWLIHQAGFAPGYGADWGRGTVRLSTKHALAVTNRGGATTSEIMAFAAHVRGGVEDRFGIRLGPECDLVNCSFDDASR
ncbi:MAG: UDP-N-acetylmuramate dehydrogenase [Rhodococcus erythropolis]